MNSETKKVLKDRLKKLNSDDIFNEIKKKYENFDLDEFEQGDLTSNDKETQEAVDKYLKTKGIDKKTLIAYLDYKFSSKETKDEKLETFKKKVYELIEKEKEGIKKDLDDDLKPEDKDTKDKEFTDNDKKIIDNVLSVGLIESIIKEEGTSEEEIENNMRQTLIAIQTLINTTKRDKKKERLQQHYDFIRNSCFDEKGNFIKDSEERIKRGDEALEKMGIIQKIRLVGTLSNSSSKEAQEDLKETYPEEWDKCEKNFNKSLKTKKKDEDEPKKDKDGNILKKEKVTDPDTGKKIKVTTHTGSRGGKFYWPEGSPKDSKHKVYVKKESILDYLTDKLVLERFYPQDISILESFRELDLSSYIKSKLEE